MLRTSSITQSTKNLLLFVDVAKDGKVGVCGVDYVDQTIERSLLTSKNLNKAGRLTSNARIAFIQLRKAFTKAPILQYFDLKCHIRIETDVSGYVISGVLSQLTNSGWWHPVAYYLQKMIPAKTWYKTHNGELLAVVEEFKKW